jgi:signal transduction histidine kinase
VGLSLVRQLIRAQRGDITVESAPGSGARFTLHIPAAGAKS